MTEEQIKQYLDEARTTLAGARHMREMAEERIRSAMIEIDFLKKEAYRMGYK
jgi:hypothetical protein